MNSRARSLFLTPRWLAVVILAALFAGGTAVWMGLQREPAQTATTFVFGRRVGFLNRPLPVLDDHLNDLVNAVEFPDVFSSIEERTLLKGDEDYQFEIGRSDDTQSVVQISVVADSAGDAERIARILAEEVVVFVLDGQLVSLDQDIDAVDAELATVESVQQSLRSLADGVSPVRALNRAEAQLLAIQQADGTPIGVLEGQLLNRVTDLRPLADEYRRNIDDIGGLLARRARFHAERSDIVASQVAVNEEWYRTITPVEPASNVPIAVAMGFAAAIPAALLASALTYVNIRRRLYASTEQHMASHATAS